MMTNAVIIQEEDQIKEKKIKLKRLLCLRGWGNVSSGVLSDAIASTTCKQLLYHLTIR